MTNQTITSTPATTEQAPTVEQPRTITYPIRGGGSLTHTCPTWCTSDHSDDVARGIDPDNLYHQGDAVSLDYHADGVSLTALVGRIAQWPFDPEDGTPYIELTPEGGTGATLTYSNRLELAEEIRRVQGHLRDLLALGEQLSEARAETHAAHTQGERAPWLTLSRIDVQSLPIAYLLRVFGVTVVEEDMGAKVAVVLGGEPGDMLMTVQPGLPQVQREDKARQALLSWYEGRTGGSRG